MTEKVDLRIAHLYAHFLNIYGDRGNIVALSQRAKWRGIEVTVDAIGLGDAMDAEYYDLYFVGGGQDKQQQIIAEDLIKRGQALRQALHSGSVILAICGGYQLLGHYYKPHTGPELRGISLIDAHTLAGNRRMIGNVVVKREDGSTLVGFENHSGKTFLGENVKALGKVVVGNGNNGDDGFEGVAEGNIFGTYLHGSLLPKNPLFTDMLLQRAIARRHRQTTIAQLDDSLEIKAHQRALTLPA